MGSKRRGKFPIGKFLHRTAAKSLPRSEIGAISQPVIPALKLPVSGIE